MFGAFSSNTEDFLYPVSTKQCFEHTHGLLHFVHFPKGTETLSYISIPPSSYASLLSVYISVFTFLGTALGGKSSRTGNRGVRPVRPTVWRKGVKLQIARVCDLIRPTWYSPSYSFRSEPGKRSGISIVKLSQRCLGANCLKREFVCTQNTTHFVLFKYRGSVN